jgi:K+/H+ antiporter YhaU regulatory subunit KhtT
MRSEKILTIGEKKAPAFVTVKTDSGDYIRVPFRLSNIDQLESMIEIREEQLKQNQAALNNLIKIKEDLESLTNDKKKKIEDILKEVVDSQ